MTQLEARQVERERKTRPTMLWMAAAIGVVVVGAGVLFLNGGSDDVAAPADIEIVQSLVAAWKTQDGDAIASHFTTDGVFDPTVLGSVVEPWIGREEIAQRTAGFSVGHLWESAIDFTQMGEELVFNLQDFDKAFSIERPLGVVVVVSDGLIESFVIETGFIYFCIGDTTSNCIVRETGEIRPAE